jgi:hypothetical protein
LFYIQFHLPIQVCLGCKRFINLAKTYDKQNSQSRFPQRASAPISSQQSLAKEMLPLVDKPLINIR